MLEFDHIQKISDLDPDPERTGFLPLYIKRSSLTVSQMSHNNFTVTFFFVVN